MFVPPPTAALSERQAQQSRGYVLGLILLIMFLSSQDFAPPSRRRAEAAHAREGITRHRDEIKEKIILDLSASNERLELENRKLKVAAVGLMSELRELGHPASAAEYNISGLGVYSGGDAKDDDEVRGWLKEKDGDDANGAKGEAAVHVDEGMRAREEAGRGGAKRERRSSSDGGRKARAGAGGETRGEDDVFERR